MYNKYIYITIGLIILIITSIYIGKSIGNKEQKNIQTVEKIKYIHADNSKILNKIDSLETINKKLSSNYIKTVEKQTIIREKASEIVIEKPFNKECDTLFDKCTEKITLLENSLILGDSIKNNLIETINIKDNIILSKDKLILNKNNEIELIKELNKPRIKKYSIGIQIGYGATVNKNQIELKPYIGVGISRKIFDF